MAKKAAQQKESLADAVANAVPRNGRVRIWWENLNTDQQGELMAMVRDSRTGKRTNVAEVYRQAQRLWGEETICCGVSAFRAWWANVDV